MMLNVSEQVTTDIDEEMNNVATAGNCDICGLSLATACDNCTRNSVVPSTSSDDQHSLCRAVAVQNTASARTFKKPSLKRLTLRLKRQTFIRSSACFGFKSKSVDGDEYSYGMSEISHNSSPEVMQTNLESLTLTDMHDSINR